MSKTPEAVVFSAHAPFALFNIERYWAEVLRSTIEQAANLAAYYSQAR